MPPSAIVLTALVVTAGTASASASGQAPLRSEALASTPEGSIPPYVFPPRKDAPRWLALGIDLRARWENRAGWQRGSDATALDVGLARTRVFVGVGSSSSPIYFAAELMDARQVGAATPHSRTVNELDVLQLRASLDLAAFTPLPGQLEVGRLSFDAVDRSLVARNRFRNTTNAFEGARLRFGKGGRASVEAFALWPTERRPTSWDRVDGNRKLFGAAASFARPSIVLEPFYFFYRSTGTGAATLHTTGLHLFGRLGRELDHDLTAVVQLGRASQAPHRAFAMHAELGRRFATAGAPRVAVWLNVATGDADPTDGRSGRFVPLFGASHAKYGFTDLFGWQNLIDPAVGLSLHPHARLRLGVVHRAYWLQSPRDAWARTGLVDPGGRSGSFLGQELDVELQWSARSYLEVNVQYGKLFTGGFAEKTGGVLGARALYVTATVGT